jgi:putative transposase
MRQGRSVRLTSQTWTTFLHNHATGVWDCDFLAVIDIFVRPHFAFFIVELASRRAVHFVMTDMLTDSWTAQRLREATPFGEGPKIVSL